MARVYFQLHGDVDVSHGDFTDLAAPFHTLKLTSRGGTGHEVTIFVDDPVGLAEQLRKAADSLDPPPVPNEGAVSEEIINDIEEELLTMGEAA